ncbi:LOW QUALITY PROTEIN: TNF receptor-associated factor 5 [Anthonomus grandis grandis]|uniref:LOW QUALITY PROTEIN: TNF receptor-associated factor 5 n=1 Tax=Anthonomus grandis grandis TaxID=2921223 RepID=UPI0021669154|nr:LOW QUALITY PROTEIN: TNF receptor-associated factor 5 [Anthonomus grandis grandis]
MSHSIRPFTCYFCNKLIENESQIGHSTLCSKVLIPCPHKCGSYIERVNLPKHITECRMNIGKSVSNQQNTSTTETNSLDRRANSEKQKIQNEIVNLRRRFSELESKLATSSGSSPSVTLDTQLEEVKDTLRKHGLSLEKFNFFNGYVINWKKSVDSQMTAINDRLKTIDAIKQELTNQWTYVREKLQPLQNMHLDITMLKESLYQENVRCKNGEFNLNSKIDELRTALVQHEITLRRPKKFSKQIFEKNLKEFQRIRQDVDEQKAKLAGFVFDLRSVSQISSEAEEKVEIMEREFGLLRQEVNQTKVNLEILEETNYIQNASHERLIWRVTEVESKLKRAKENDIVLKGPVFYTHRYGYKIRVLLYLNGLQKWKDRYALACIHVLKGEYDPLLAWPCAIDASITLRSLNADKSVTKFIKTKKSSGDEEEDEPQESSQSYIFIPHSVLFKENFVKNDTFFLDISIRNSEIFRQETNL